MALNQHKTDPKAESEGAWFSYYRQDMWMCLAYAGPSNTEFHRAKSKAERRLGSQYKRADEIPDSEWRKAMAPVYADHIILEWKGVRWNEGDPDLPLTKQNVIAVLTDPQLPDLFPQVLKDSSNTEAYRVQDLESESGN